MAVDPAADRIVDLDDPDRAIVELAAVNGPACTRCLAADLPLDRLAVSDRVATLVETGHLRETGDGRYTITEHAQARVLGVDGSPTGR